MAGEHFDIKKGARLTVSSVSSGTKQDGSEWMQIHIKDETGKIEAGMFLDEPIKNLREGDIIEVDDVWFRAKRSPNRYAYDKPKGPCANWVKFEKPNFFITEPSPQIKAHIAVGGPFTYGSMDGGGLGDAGFDPNEGELPF